MVWSAANLVISADLKICCIILHGTPQQSHFASGTFLNVTSLVALS